MTFLDVFLIGIGLSLDACCVCTSNGLFYRPNARQAIQYGLVFGIFQGIMPLLGFLGTGILNIKIFEYNSFIALVLLSVVGGRMVYESLGAKSKEENGHETGLEVKHILTGSMLLMQGVSTSIDALSVGITFYKYTMSFVLCAVVLIAVITWVLCFVALRIGIKIGTKWNGKAEMFGGMVLILLGIKIFLVG